MLETLSQAIARQASWSTWCLLLAAAFLVGYAMKGSREGCPETLDGQRWGYGPAEIDPILDAFDDDTRRTYLWTEASLDMAFPLVYGGLLAVWISLMVQTAGGSERWMLLNLVPAAAALADYLENVQVIAVLALDRSRPEALYPTLAAASRLKWWLLTLAVVVATLVAGVALVGILRRLLDRA